MEDYRLQNCGWRACCNTAQVSSICSVSRIGNKLRPWAARLLSGGHVKKERGQGSGWHVHEGRDGDQRKTGKRDREEDGMNVKAGTVIKERGQGSGWHVNEGRGGDQRKTGKRIA